MRVSVNGAEIEYTVDGEEGPWVIMSHSLGCTLAMWDNQVPVLKGKYRVLRYDTRGHGGSSATPAPYTLNQLADDALGLLDHLGIEQVHWVGFSMGGMIGQTFALRYPQRLLSLVLSDTTSAHTGTPHAMWEERIRVAREQGIAPLVGPAIGRWFTERYRRDHGDDVARVAEMIAQTSVNGWCGCCAAIASIDTTNSLHRIALPVMVMVGEHDIGTPLSAALDMHRRLDNSVLVVISDAAHMTCIEQPVQFNRALSMFLDSV